MAMRSAAAWPSTNSPETSTTTCSRPAVNANGAWSSAETDDPSSRPTVSPSGIPMSSGMVTGSSPPPTPSLDDEHALGAVVELDRGGDGVGPVEGPGCNLVRHRRGAREEDIALARSGERRPLLAEARGAPAVQGKNGVFPRFDVPQRDHGMTTLQFLVEMRDRSRSKREGDNREDAASARLPSRRPPRPELGRRYRRVTGCYSRGTRRCFAAVQ